MRLLESMPRTKLISLVECFNRRAKREANFDHPGLEATLHVLDSLKYELRKRVKNCTEHVTVNGRRVSFGS
jgi:hypothetical protein